MNMKHVQVLKLMRLGYQFKIKNRNYVVTYVSPGIDILRRHKSRFIVQQGSVNEHNRRKARNELIQLAIAAAWAHYIRMRSTS